MTYFFPTTLHELHVSWQKIQYVGKDSIHSCKWASGQVVKSTEQIIVMYVLVQSGAAPLSHVSGRLVIDVETVFRERCLSTIQMPSQNATVSLRKEFHRQKTFTYGLLHNCAFQGTYHKYEFKEEKVKRSW